MESATIEPVAATKERPHPIKAVHTHLASLGFTNRLAIYIVLLLAAGLAGGFYLAVECIEYGYTSALACWTVVFTPIGTACSVVLSKIVDKSKAENTSADGEGIKYATAKANNFGVTETTDEEERLRNSPQFKKKSGAVNISRCPL